MSESPLLLSEAMQGFGALRLKSDSCEAALISVKQSFTKVRVLKEQLDSLEDAFYFLCPLASAPTRYLLIGVGAWSFLVSNHVEDIPIAEVNGISRATGCTGAAVAARKSNRQIHFYSESKPVRKIQSFEDEDGWYYLESEDPLNFEDASETKIRRRKERLQPEIVKRYFERFTRRPFPDWSRDVKLPVVGLEFYYPKYAVPILLYPTRMDMLEGAEEPSVASQTVSIEVETPEFRIRMRRRD
jgi:hypothetical protein